MLLQIDEKRIEPDIMLIELVGKLAMGRECQRVESIIEDLLKSGNLRVVLDMSRVDHIDSAGVGVITLSAGRMKEGGGRLIVVAPDGRVLHLLKMTQVNLIVTVCATQSEAIAAFG